MINPRNGSHECKNYHAETVAYYFLVFYVAVVSTL